MQTAKLKIDIDMSKKCRKCKKAGANPNGLCLSCNTDRMLGGVFAKSLAQGVTMIRGQLTDYADRIQKTFLSLEEDEVLNVSISLKLSGSNDKVRVETGISFTESKVKDSAVELVQATPLFDKVGA